MYLYLLYHFSRVLELHLQIKKYKQQELISAVQLSIEHYIPGQSKLITLLEPMIIFNLEGCLKLNMSKTEF